MSKIEWIVIISIPFLGGIGALFAWLGHVMYGGARMAHENEPLEPREWRQKKIHEQTHPTHTASGQ